MRLHPLRSFEKKSLNEFTSEKKKLQKSLFIRKRNNKNPSLKSSEKVKPYQGQRRKELDICLFMILEANANVNSRLHI